MCVCMCRHVCMYVRVRVPLTRAHLSVLSYSKRLPGIREPVNFTCFIEYIRR